MGNAAFLAEMKAQSAEALTISLPSQGKVGVAAASKTFRPDEVNVSYANGQMSMATNDGSLVAIQLPSGSIGFANPRGGAMEPGAEAKMLATIKFAKVTADFDQFPLYSKSEPPDPRAAWNFIEAANRTVLPPSADAQTQTSPEQHIQTPTSSSQRSRTPTSDPKAGRGDHWMAATMPASAYRENRVPVPKI